MKRLIVFVLLLFSLVIFSSCDPASVLDSEGIVDGSEKVKVKFVIDGDITEKTFTKDGVIIYPEIPKKEYHRFAGWYFDEEGTKPAYLGSSVDSDITLYAIYEFDFEAAVNAISQNLIKATVGIEATHNKTSFGYQTSSKKIAGSGVIFKEQGGVYYVLSNQHVVERISGYSSVEYNVVDCYGNSHVATLVAMDSEYDLSLLTFAKGNTELCSIDFSENVPKVKDSVISVGTPSGLDNNITLGEITRIESLKPGDIGYRPFDVIWHDAPIDHGSSGGVLLGEDLRIIGINYAVGTSASSNEFICGLAVPTEKVLEFLDNNK